ncbi:MAG: transcriptional regulator [Thermoplasmata archaeon]
MVEIDTDTFKELLSDKALKSTSRLIILLIIAMNGKITFTKLHKYIEGSKGSLKNNLDILEESGLIRSYHVFSLKGPRLIYEITEKGLSSYRKYIELLNKINKNT